jgi:cyclase
MDGETVEVSDGVYVGNLYRAYAELAGGERGAPVDALAALADMVAFNGGMPLACHA